MWEQTIGCIMEYNFFQLVNLFRNFLNNQAMIFYRSQHAPSHLSKFGIIFSGYSSQSSTTWDIAHRSNNHLYKPVATLEMSQKFFQIRNRISHVWPNTILSDTIGGGNKKGYAHYSITFHLKAGKNTLLLSLTKYWLH